MSTSEVSSLQWLGATLRIAALSTTPGAPAKGSARATSSRAVVTIVDLAAHSKHVLLDEPWKSTSSLQLRACPSGRYLLIVPSPGVGATALWRLPIGAAPAKVRQLPMHFTALAFVLPSDQVRGWLCTSAGFACERVDRVCRMLPPWWYEDPVWPSMAVAGATAK